MFATNRALDRSQKNLLRNSLRSSHCSHYASKSLVFHIMQVILKMDKQGNGLEIDQDNMGRCRSLGNVFTEEKFRHMCILSGCDYLASLHGIGLGKACKLLRLAKDPDILKVPHFEQGQVSMVGCTPNLLLSLSLLIQSGSNLPTACDQNGIQQI